MITLQAIQRDIFGKKVKKLRESELVPVELYGRGKENLHLAVPRKDFTKVFKEAGESTIVVLKTEGGSARNVLIHDTQEDPLTNEITHIDFYEVRMDEKLTATVPLRFVGDAPGVKEKEGVLVRAVQELEVEALPADLPPGIDVDLTTLLDIGSSIHVKDLKISEKVRILVEPETVVATIVPPVVEEEPAGPADVSEVKIEGEEKKKEAAAAAEGETTSE